MVAARRQGGRPRQGRPGAGCASMRARPSRPPPPATRRCRRRARRWTWPARNSSASSSCSRSNYISQAALERAESQFKATQAQVNAQLAQAGAARTQSGLLRRRARPTPASSPRCRWRWATWRCPAAPLLTAVRPGGAARHGGRAADCGDADRQRPGRCGPNCPACRRPASGSTPARVQVLPTVDAGDAHGAGARRSARRPRRRRAGHVRARVAAAAGHAGSPAAAGLSVPRQAIVRRAEMTGLYVLDPNGRPRPAPGAPRPQRRRPRRGPVGADRRASAWRSIRRPRPACAETRHDDTGSHARMGISGRIAAFFQRAQITPLLALVALLLGIFAVLVTPREEEPQINVTMANVLIPFPGRLGARRRADGRRAGRAGAVADRRHRARDVGVAAGPGGDHRAVQGRACRAPRRWCACTTPSTPTPTGCPRAWACSTRSSSPRASTTCRSSR